MRSAFRLICVRTHETHYKSIKIIPYQFVVDPAKRVVLRIIKTHTKAKRETVRNEANQRRLGVVLVAFTLSIPG